MPYGGVVSDRGEYTARANVCGAVVGLAMRVGNVARGEQASPLRPASRPRIPTARGRRELLGMTVRNACEFVRRDCACACYLYILDRKGWLPARAGQDAMGGGLDGHAG